MPSSTLYRQSLQSRADADATVIMLIDNIGPGPRSPAMPRFDRNRIISELRAIRLGYAMSPIEVTKATDQDYSITVATDWPPRSLSATRWCRP